MENGDKKIAQLQDGEAEYLAELIKNPAICATCLDQGVITQALPDHFETFMYCPKHHPAHQPKKPPQKRKVVKRIA